MKGPDEILQGNAETFREKDADYGSSWRQAGEILATLAGDDEVVLETAEDFTSLGLFTRRLDKLVRAFNAEFLAEGEPNFESIGDSHEDESTYAAMHASLLAEQDTFQFFRKGSFKVNTDPVGVLKEIEGTITVGGDDKENITDPGEPPVSLTNFSKTEDGRDEKESIHPAYQEKYEDLVGDGE